MSRHQANRSLASTTRLSCAVSCLRTASRRLEGYQGAPETRDAILTNLARGFEHLLKPTLWLLEESEESIGRHHSIPRLLDRRGPVIGSTCERHLGGADYGAKRNLRAKVLDFVQSGGPNLTVDSTTFEVLFSL